MASKRSWILIALTLFVTAAVQARPSSGVSVTVSRRSWFGICTGICPSYDITVTSDGQVVVQGVPLGGDLPINQGRRYHVTRDAVTRFLARLRPLRPKGERDTHIRCEHDVPPDEQDLIRDTTEIKIEWRSRSGLARLVACDNADDQYVLHAIDHALAEIRFWPSGARMPSNYQPGED